METDSKFLLNFNVLLSSNIVACCVGAKDSFVPHLSQIIDDNHSDHQTFGHIPRWDRTVMCSMEAVAEQVNVLTIVHKVPHAY